MVLVVSDSIGFEHALNGFQQFGVGRPGFHQDGRRTPALGHMDIACRKNNHRRPGPQGLNIGEDIPAGPARQAQVQQDEIKPLRPQPRPGLRQRCREFEGRKILGNGGGDALYVQIVLNMQDARPAGGLAVDRAAYAADQQVFINWFVEPVGNRKQLVVKANLPFLRRRSARISAMPSWSGSFSTLASAPVS